LGLDQNNSLWNPVQGFLYGLTLAGFGRDLNFVSQGSRETLEPWAEISERLRRNDLQFKLTHYRLRRRLANHGNKRHRDCTALDHT
jgi:hypothetical protein